MKVILVTLSGDPDKAFDTIKALYLSAEIECVPRSLLESGSMLERLKRLRVKRPDVFAIMTESVPWLSGRQALMLFGVLAGAKESLIIDAYGRLLRGKKLPLLLASPFGIAAAFFRGILGTRRAKRNLSRLEFEIALKKPPRLVGDDLRVVYLRATPGPGMQPGGAASHIIGVVKSLAALGASVTVISNDEIAGLNKEGLTFHKIVPDIDALPRAVSDTCNGMKFSEQASSLISSAPPSFVYQRYARFSYAGAEAAARSGVPLFLEYNGSEVWLGKNWDGTSNLDLLERFERLNLEAATRIFVVSQVEKNNLIAAGISSHKIVVNPNGVDADEFRPGIGGLEARNELKVSDSTVLVGFVGTFGPWHGVLALADAIALTPEDAEIKFLLVGGGSLRLEVEEKLRQSGTIDRVIFVGVVPHKRVPVLLDACDILVSPHVPLAEGSEFFGSPTKLFEYMAMGKGIVASRLGQIGDVLIHDQTALLVEPGNAADLSVAVIKMANDAKMRMRLGNAARARAISHHTWHSNAARIVEEFQALHDQRS